jgi:deoxyribonuclease V
VIACVDVHYEASPAGGERARGAVVTIASLGDAEPHARRVALVPQVEPYEPGAFYRRELPCIRAALAMLDAMPEVVIVDGHAWLDVGVPGLGARLLEAEPRIRTVIGVAKTRFRETPATEVFRGRSRTPLWVDEAGEPIDAARAIMQMHGPHRVPTMLRLVDQLCRGLVQ